MCSLQLKINYINITVFVLNVSFLTDFFSSIFIEYSINVSLHRFSGNLALSMETLKSNLLPTNSDGSSTGGSMPSSISSDKFLYPLSSVGIKFNLSVPH